MLLSEVSSGTQIKTKIGILIIHSVRALPTEEYGLFKIEVNFESNGNDCSLDMNDFLTLITILH